MMKRVRFLSAICAFSVAASAAGFSPSVVFAQTGTTISAQQAQNSAVRGSLVDQAGGVPVANATVRLVQGTSTVTTAKTDANGNFVFPSEPAGIYHIEVRATGYQGVRSDDITIINGGSATNFRAALARVSGGSTGFREIGRVSAGAGGNRSTVSTSTTISQTVTTDLVQKEGYNRVGDAVGNLPGITAEGQSSSLGDDQYINIRGFGSGETQTLIDGHPLGPFGPGTSGFSSQVSPTFALGKTVVTYGSGALGLYGTDSIGGTIDLQTVEPTLQPHQEVTQGFGNLGTSLTGLTATGTIGRLGYALVHGVQGAYGNFKPGVYRPQAGLLGPTDGIGPDVSSANLAANTYTTSGNYLLTNNLVKFRYKIDDRTNLLVSDYAATSWDDKSGNGDNCYLTYPLQLYKGQQLVTNPTTGAPVTTTYYDPANVPAGANNLNCTGSIAAKTDNGLQCITPAAYASATSGFNGGGIGPWQSHRVDDYHARLQRQIGANLVTLDAFTNRFTTDYNRNVSGGLDPTGTFFTGGFNADYYNTTGELISDDVVSERNDVGFGYYLQHQRQYGNRFDYPYTKIGQIVPVQDFGLGTGNIFLRDQFEASHNVTAYLNAWQKHSTVTGKTTFDPRLSLVFRTSPADVLRITGGRSDGEPSPDLVEGVPLYNATPQNISNVGCGGLLGVGSVSNPVLQPEASNDLEIAYGHRFNGDDIVQVNAYESFEKNRIFGGILPLNTTSQPIPPPGSNLLSQYLAIYDRACPGQTATAANLGVNTNFNAASARLQGIEISGRHRFNQNVYADYYYDIQSAVLLAVPDYLLLQSATSINGAQIAGIPLHKASIGIDYSNNHGLELRTDVYYISENNSYSRPAFFYGNASLTKDIGRHATLNLGVQNVFNSAVQNALLIGAAPFQGENQFFNDSNTIQQVYNGNAGGGQNGLLPTQFTLSLTLRN